MLASVLCKLYSSFSAILNAGNYAT